jgi:peptidoglycan/LPS O-acetylase OafA/YrhL
MKSMFTLPKNNVPEWDGWRGLAISCVLIGHFMGTDFIKEDRLGVDIFFVLSGMLMARLLFEKRVDLKTFYVRRFSRVFPALLVFVAVSFAVAKVAGWQFSSSEVIANLTFIRSYFPVEPHIWSGQVPVKNLWSLNVEEHAYVIMSLMTLIFINNRNAAALLFAIGLTSIGISLYYSFTQENNGSHFLLRTECAIGFVAMSAAYRLAHQNWDMKISPWVPVIALVASALTYLTAVPFWMSIVFPPLFLAFAINHIQDSLPLFKVLLSNKIFRYLGLWSFSIYLWQQPLYEYKWAIPGPEYGIPLIASIILGALSFVIIETPARTAINNWWAQRDKKDLDHLPYTEMDKEIKQWLHNQQQGSVVRQGQEGSNKTILRQGGNEKPIPDSSNTLSKKQA